MKKLIVLASCVALQLLFVSVAFAATVYVDAKNNSGIEDGTLAYPFNEIQEAINNAAPYAGDIVQVAPGIYYGSLEMKRGVRLVSEQGPEVTIVDCMGDTYGIISPLPGNGAVIDIAGFTIRNARYLIHPDSRDFYNFLNKCKVDNCILDGGGIGSGTVGIYAGRGSKLTITRTVFKNMNYAITGFNFPGMYLNNVTIDNVGNAISNPYPKYSPSITMNNTTISNCQTAISLRTSKSFYWVPKVVGSNNNFWNCTTIISDPGPTKHPIINEMVGTMSYNPKFIDYVNSDLHLDGSSPLIDAGVDVGLPFNGSAPDVGAYETDQVSLVDMAQILFESTQEIPRETFKNAEEQRRNALSNKLMAVLDNLNLISDEMNSEENLAILNDCANKLRNDILAKTDGFYGGNPKNDWITDEEEQQSFYPEVMMLLEAIEGEIAAIPTSS